MDLLKNKKGFTLIEVMVVILIVGVLSSLAVSGYIQYRKATLLDFSVDALQAQVQEFRGQAARGQFGGERFEQLRGELAGELDELEEKAESNSKCFGLYFQKDDQEDLYTVRSFEQDFAGKRLWRTDIQDWIYQGCGEFSPGLQSVEFGDLELDQEVKLVELEYREGELLTAVEDDFVLRFLPPDGETEFRYDVFEFDEALSDTERLVLTLQYGDDDRTEYQRELVINLN